MEEIDERSQLLMSPCNTNEERETAGETEEYLKDYEIWGETKHIQQLQQLFDNSSVKIRVVQRERPALNEVFGDKQTDEQGNGKEACGRAKGGARNDAEETCPTVFSSSSSSCFTVTNNCASKKCPVYLSSEENSSGFDSDEEVVLPTISPEIMNRKNIIMVQSRIKNLPETSLITPTRIYLREGTFFKCKGRCFVFFLFDDLLVIAKAKANCEETPAVVGTPKRVKFRRALDLKRLEAVPLPDSNKGKNLLELQYSTPNKRWKRVFAAPTKEQRDLWFTELCTLHENLVLNSVL